MLRLLAVGDNAAMIESLNGKRHYRLWVALPIAIVAVLIDGAMAPAAQLFKGNGTLADSGSDEARTIADWCDLASKAKSGEDQWKYALTLEAIAKSVENQRLPLVEADKVAIRTAAALLFKNSWARCSGTTRQDEIGPDIRRPAINALLPAADESCLPNLFAALSDAPPFGSVPVKGYADRVFLERSAAAHAIIKIGGDKVLAGLVKVAKSSDATWIERDEAGNGIPGRGNRDAVKIIGHFPEADAVPALKSIAAYADEINSPVLSKAANAELDRIADQKAALENLRKPRLQPRK